MMTFTEFKEKSNAVFHSEYRKNAICAMTITAIAIVMAVISRMAAASPGFQDMAYKLTFGALTAQELMTMAASAVGVASITAVVFLLLKAFLNDVKESAHQGEQAPQHS